MFARFRPTLILLEAGLLGLFFVQALRYLIGALYSRVSSAALLSTYPTGSYDETLPGIVDPAIVSAEIVLLSLVVALPLFTLILGRWRYAPFVGAMLVVFGRALMTFPLLDAITPAMGATIAVAGGLFTVCVLVAQRTKTLPFFFVLGFAFDQVIRAYGDTMDPTVFEASRQWTQVIGTSLLTIDFFVVLGVLMGLALVASLVNVVVESADEEERLRGGRTIDPNRGLLTIWGALGMAGLLFVELSLLALPNAIMGRSGTELYTLFVTLTLVATLLPIIPSVREQARSFIAPFDSNTRGWIWLIFVALMLVLGMRLQALPLGGLSQVPLGGIALVIAQLAVSMMWWWLARPKSDEQRNWGGLWMIVMVIMFGLLLAGDIFTYEYAFVREFAVAGNPSLTETLNSTILPLLRGFRGLGLGLILFAVLLASLPMIQATRRIPWTGGKLMQSVLSVLFVAFTATAGWFAARPVLAQSVTDVETLRIGTYNLHAGYSEFYAPTLDLVLRDVLSSGAAVVMLQDVEAGRLTSFGVDQPLWLARQLGMDKRFYATNEGILGLAVLSRVPIVFDDGELLPSIDRQTGLQRVQIQPTLNATSVITLYNTELGFLLQGDGLSDLEANQVTQVQSILGILEQHRTQEYGGQFGRMVLGGTFHNVASAPVMNFLRNYGFNDPFAGTNLTLTATLNRSNLDPARVDYLWVWQQSLPQVGPNVVNSVASDHRMAYVEFQISVGD